jgi:hypothetical protein
MASGGTGPAGAGGSGATGGTAPGGTGAPAGGSGGSVAGSGGSIAGSGGSAAGGGGSIAGSGGSVAGRGGSAAGSGGSVAGSGGSMAGSGGSVAGRGGSAAGSGGSVAGSGGSMAGSGGRAGGTAGSVAGNGGRAGGTAGSPAGGSGGGAGAAPYTCPLGGMLDCSAAGALKLTPDGTVTSFSALEWNSSTERWCNALGLDGKVFAYSAAAAPNASTATVETTGARGLTLDMTVGAQGYAGGGLNFDSCVDASAFNALEFTLTTVSGSLTGCAWQVQLETQDQRPNNVTDPTGGTCNPNGSGGCYRFPAVSGLANPGTTGMTYTQLFTAFSNPASSTIPLRSQIVGIQWQVNSANSGSGTCAVVLRVDDIKFVTR